MYKLFLSYVARLTELRDQPIDIIWIIIFCETVQTFKTTAFNEKNVNKTAVYRLLPKIYQIILENTYSDLYKNLFLINYTSNFVPIFCNDKSETDSLISFLFLLFTESTNYYPTS